MSHLTVHINLLVPIVVAIEQGIPSSCSTYVSSTVHINLLVPIVTNQVFGEVSGSSCWHHAINGDGDFH